MCLDGLDERLSPTAWGLLSRVDVTKHNAGASPPDFENVVSQVVSAAQFAHPDFDRLRRLIYPRTVVLPWGRSPGTGLHRKIWEFVYVLRAAEQAEVLVETRRAIGFGVGREPIPAVLARFGLSVLATDLPVSHDDSQNWTGTGQHLSDLGALSLPDVVPDEVLERLVSVRYVDMNEIPADLGTFDLVWSCCALEHLGSPAAGLEFVLSTLDLLEPGGVSVHTTELELAPRDKTADYGDIVVYRTEDLDELAQAVRMRGYEIDTNWYVSLETPADRWIGSDPYDEPAYLKLAIGESITTSVGVIIQRPPGGSDERQPSANRVTGSSSLSFPEKA